MNINDFSKLPKINSLIPKLCNSKTEISKISIVVTPGNFYWVENEAFVFIISNFINQDDISSILRSLINKKIIGCCFISNNRITEINVNICKNFDLPLFSYDDLDNISSFWNTIFSFSNNRIDIQNFLFSQLKSNIICLMNSSYFNEKNLTDLVSIFFHREVYLLSSDYNLLYQGKYFKTEITSNIPLIQWSDELSSWNKTASYSLDPVNLYFGEKVFLCFPLKSETNILGYLCIEDMHPLWNRLNIVNATELLPYYIICIVHYSKTKVFRRKSFEEFLQSTLYGFITDPSDLKREAANFDFEYYLNRYLWILRIEPLDNNKDITNTNIANQIITYAKNLSEKYFYNNIFLTESTQVISVQIKDDTPDEVEWPKYLKILDTLELQFPEYRFYIGFSRAYPSLYELKNAYEDAVFSISMGKKIFNNTKNIFNYNDLLIYHLLYNQIDNPIIKRLYSNSIRQIEIYDNKKNDVLLNTLTILIENNFNYKLTADSLFIHRNTLYQRLNKIESIIRMSLKKSETRLLLQLGVKFGHIINMIEQGNDNDI